MSHDRFLWRGTGDCVQGNTKQIRVSREGLLFMTGVEGVLIRLRLARRRAGKTRGKGV
jgi:hypothetical protein